MKRQNKQTKTPLTAIAKRMIPVLRKYRNKGQLGRDGLAACDLFESMTPAEKCIYVLWKEEQYLGWKELVCLVPKDNWIDPYSSLEEAMRVKRIGKVARLRGSKVLVGHEARAAVKKDTLARLAYWQWQQKYGKQR